MGLSPGNAEGRAPSAGDGHGDPWWLKPGFLMRLMPRFDVATGTMTGADSLVGWKGRSGALLSAGRLFRRAEQDDVSVPFMITALSQAASMCSELLAAGLHGRIGIGVPSAFVCDERLPSLLDIVLSRSGLPSKWLILEISEDAFLLDPERAQGALGALAEVEATLALNDFNPGYSFLSQMAQMPFDEVKIDRTFLRSAASLPADRYVLTLAVELSRSLGRLVVADGIDDLATLHVACDAGVDAVQGSLFGPPQSAAELIAGRTGTLATARTLLVHASTPTGPGTQAGHRARRLDLTEAVRKIGV